MSRYKLIWISVIVVLLDQATKLRVRHTMELRESVPVLGDFFNITYVTNPGGAFSFALGQGQANRLFFIVVPFIALFVILYMIRKLEDRLQLVAYYLVIGGAVGNLIDRIAYGEVIDFLDVDFFFFTSYRYPVFNIADSAITIAIGILMVDLIFFSKKEVKTSEKQNESTG